MNPTPEQCLICLVELVNRAPKTQTELAGLQSLVNIIEAALVERKNLLDEKAKATLPFEVNP